MATIKQSEVLAYSAKKYEQINQFTLVLMTDESEKVTGRDHGKEYARIIFVIK